MARYALIENGVVVNVIEADEETANKMNAIPALFAGIGWLWDGAAFSPPPPVPPPRQTKLTRLEYLTRFTDAEAVAIDLASIGATVEAASLRRLAKLVDNAEFIDLDDPRVMAGVQMLEAAGLISPGRAAEILA